MDNNRLIIKKNWGKRNWKWLLPLFIIAPILFGLAVTAGSGGGVTDIVKAYADDSLYQKAIKMANGSPRSLEVLGKIEPLDKLAILEGNTVYSNTNSVESTVRIKGSKGKAKLDIFAAKADNRWIYRKIVIRIKESEEEIEILNITN